MRSVWLSRRSIALHIVIVIIVPTFAALCVWQVRRALGGNDLSWAYVFEWPFFAGYAVYMWWRFVHEAPAGAAPPAPAAPIRTASAPSQTDGAEDADGDDADADAPERAAYNRYLADLAARGKRKQWR